MLEILKESPILLLFVVLALGYPLGMIRIAGFSLGLAAILFTGLAIGSLDTDLSLPKNILDMGLVLFVYTLGLASAPGFIASFNKQGFKNSAMALAAITLIMGLVFLAVPILNISPATAAGLFTGSLTNTPALASAIERLSPDLGNAAVIAYSLCYPLGCIMMMLAIYFFRTVFRIPAEAQPEKLSHHTIVVAHDQEVSLKDLQLQHGWQVVFSRFQRQDHLSLADENLILKAGDLINAVGPQKHLDQVVSYLGQISTDSLDENRHELDFRRMFVSSHHVAGKKLRDLKLTERFGALVTRIRRGDQDIIPTKDTLLELGDRVRVVAPPNRLREIARLFGDSYKSLSEMDVMTFALGITLGLFIGKIPLPLPGGHSFELGLAGGPLLVGLILGAIRRTGPLVWTLPYSVNLTLRQFGLVLFFAAIGTRSGFQFAQTLQNGEGLSILLAGMVLTTITALFILSLGYFVLRIPFSYLTGFLAGVQTQPAVLVFALDNSKNESPNIGYAAIAPLAILFKIILVQILLNILK